MVVDSKQPASSQTQKITAPFKALCRALIWAGREALRGIQYASQHDDR